MKPVGVMEEMGSVKMVALSDVSDSRYPGAGVGRRQPGLKFLGIILSMRRVLPESLEVMSL
jgi:hypothetical protein